MNDKSDFHGARVTPHPDSDEAKRRVAAVQNAGSQDALAKELEKGLSTFKPNPQKKPFVAEELNKKADLYAERNKIYGDNYHRFGPILSLIMDTQKLDCKNTHDMSRLGVFVQLVAKVTRYGENFNRGGHDDSLDDISVYAMMLKELDRK